MAPFTAALDLPTGLEIDRDFAPLAHGYQDAPPAANNGGPWTTWLVLGGRGAGKTRLGADWVRALAHGRSPYAERRHMRIALVGETEHDARAVMVEGESGLLANVLRCERPAWIPSRRLLQWPNGAMAQTFSADDPDSLRGPQFEAAWCDELAKWRYADDAFNTLRFALRLGEAPRQLITTTPRPIALIKRLLDDPRTAVTRAASQVNAAHLSPRFLDAVVAQYAGTRLGRQEIDAEIVEDLAGALWTRDMIEAARVAQAPPLLRVVVAIDPPASAREGANACGIVAAGRAADGCVYVLADATAAGLSPAGWAARAITLYHRLRADALVAEGNQGGDMVRAVVQQVDPSVPLKIVHATHGKRVRAEPIAALYEQKRVKHVDPPLRELEDQMCQWSADRLAAGSPDRLDALVWAATELIAPGWEGPRIRVL